MAVAAAAKVAIKLAPVALDLIKGSGETGNKAVNTATEVNNRVRIDGKSPAELLADQVLAGVNA